MPSDPLAPCVANEPLTTEQQEGRLTDAEGKISPATFPVPTASPDFISTMAENLRSSGEAISDSGADIKSSWGGLTSCYEAPHQEELYEVLDPVASDGNRVMYGINRMANALEDFAEALSSIKTRWSSLRTDSYEFLARIAEEGDDWDDGVGFLWLSENPNVAENRALYERGVGLIEEYEEAERDCANRINANVENRTRFESMPSDGELDDDVFYHGYEDDLSDLATEWDSGPAGTDLPWWGDAGVAVWDFGVGAVEGTGAMLGMHSSQGWFNMSWGDALYEYHEDNIQSALGLVGLYDAESDSYGWSGWDNVGSARKDLVHSVVPWEEWGERPGYVIGTALLNIGGTVGGAALSATGVGATVGVPLMAWRGASILDGMGSGRGPGGGGVDLDLSGTTVRVSNTHMQAIQAYMDQLVNPNYTNISGASDIDLGDLAGEGSGRRSNTQQNQDSPENNPAPRRTGEEADPRTEELQAFEQIMDDNPDLKRTLEEGEPALGEHDPVSLELGDGSWEGAPGDGRRPVPVGADRPSDPLAAGNDFGNAQDNRYDLSSAEDPSSVAPRGNSTSVTDRAPHTVLNQDGGGAGRGGGTRHESFDEGQGPRNDSLQDGGSDQRSHSSEGSGSGNDADTYDTSSGGSGGSSNGPRSGQDSNSPFGPDRGFQDSGNHRQGNEWDREWNTSSLDDRYRPPVVTDPDRIHEVEKGSRGRDGEPRYPGKNTPFTSEGLRSDSVYQVEERGNYYTDNNGKVNYVDTHAGMKGNRNPDLRDPLPETTYAVDVIENKGKKYFYETDGRSRTTHAHGELQRIRMEEGGKTNDLYRAPDQGKENKFGSQDFPENQGYNPKKWDGGHFFGTGFGGSGHHINLHSQLRDLNQKIAGGTKETSFYALESEWRDHLDNNKKVDVWFDAEYSSTYRTPDSVTVRHSVDGVEQPPITYDNTPGLKDESTHTTKPGPTAGGS
ncbi:MAG TPA: DNA/RNA non-specific endonuclease, partial [Candidatus Nocardiopsis merdipullorum]|nr:DNA/RNA non-specific endonuclease [Candidatus Nocardiopsis merdipullorum]